MPITVFPATVANGRTNAFPCELAIATDANISRNVARFDATTEERLHFAFPIPANYLSGNVTLRARWRANATSGDVVWNASYYFLSNNNTTLVDWDSSATTSTSATAFDINESTFTLSQGVGTNKLLSINFSRHGANVSDTLSVDAELTEVSIEYTSDATITKGYQWIPAGAFCVPNGSGATVVSNLSMGSAINPALVAFTDAANQFVDARFTLPSSYNGNLKVTTWLRGGTDTNKTLGFTIGMGAASLGSTLDPTLTTSSTYTVTTNTNNQNYSYVDLQRDAPISPTAGQECVIRITRDNADTAIATWHFAGVLIEYDVNNRNPAFVRFDPAAASLPTTNPASIIKVNDTNSSKYIGQYADGATQIIDFSGYLPATYAAGGNLKLRWRTPASSGNAYFRVDWGSPANGTASDPTLTQGTPFASETGGAGVINEVSMNISAGLVAGDTVLIRVVRLADDPLDTLSNTVDLLDVVLETSIVS